MKYSLRAFLLLIAFSHPSQLYSEKPHSILIIGGGPCGLASALLAKKAGIDVVIVEKREKYTRDRFIFLHEASIDLMEDLQVFIPDLMIGSYSGYRFGFTNIKNLELGLAERVEAQQIPVIRGEFQQFSNGKALIAQADETIELSYDLLIGADGLHSTVRDQLEIPLNVYGKALGSTAIIPLDKGFYEFIPPFQCDSLFIAKVITPGTILISAQAEGKEVSKELMTTCAFHCGWVEEAICLTSDQVRYLDKVEISLQQASRFSDRTHSAILLGDAAASASYLQGMGVNCGFEEVLIAAEVFKTDLTESDYASYEAAMQRVTDELVQDSLFLFP